MGQKSKCAEAMVEGHDNRALAGQAGAAIRGLRTRTGYVGATVDEDHDGSAL
jgi:hypothetical protein